MRNEDVVKGFLNKVKLSANNIHSTGDKLFSYDTCIAEWVGSDTLIGNATKYSSTTSKHMYYIKSHVNKWTVKEVPRGAESLTAYISEQII